ncbi:Transmembrane protein [Pleurotus pulmonarius]
MVRTVQDTDPSFSFSPSKLWSDNPDQIGLFNGGSGHQITGPTSGDGVQLFGPIGPLGAPYTVQIDGGPVRSLTSARDFYIPQMMLFHADNLGDGNHVLRLEYHGSSTNQTFAIDYANIINASSMKSSRSRAGSASMSRGLSGGLIAAIVILVLLIVACIIAFFLIMRRRWYLPPNDRKLFNEGMPARPPLPPVAPSSYYTGYTSSANRMAYGRGNGQRERLTRGNTISSPSILTFTSFDPSVSLGRHSTTGRSYYARSEGIPEETIPESSVPYATVASSAIGSGNSIAALNRTRTTQNIKGQTVMMPPAAGAGRELPAPPIEEQPRPTGTREVDDRQSRFYPSDIAPPDYHQATVPSGESRVQDEKGNRSVINR